MTDSVEEILKKRIFTSGYMLGKKHGYTDAVEESYPELQEGQTEVGAAVGDAITQYLNPHNRRSDPSADFGG
jgi:hypothetical protein